MLSIRYCSAAAVFSHVCSPDVASLASEDVAVVAGVTGDPDFYAGRNARHEHYALGGNSSCRDSGVSLGWMAKDIDLALRKRLFGKADIGCYERRKADTIVILR